MAENLSQELNNARFKDYPYDIRRDSWTDLQTRRLELLASRVKIREEVLDIGCNSGGLVEFLGGCFVHGVDLCPALVETAKTRLMSAQVASAEHLPFLDKSMDVVVLGEILEYVYDPSDVLSEAVRVARRAVIGSVDHEDGTWGAERVDKHAYMVRGYTRLSLLDALAEVGVVTWLPVVRSQDDTPQFYLFEVLPYTKRQ